MSRLVGATALAMALAAPQAASQPPPVVVWTARALATVLDVVGDEFTRDTGRRLIVHSDLPNGFSRRAAAGERFDVLITVAAPMEDWIRSGRVVPASRRDLARSGIGVAVKAGSRRRDVGTVEALKRTLLDATSIAYLRVGSGLYLDTLLTRLGIAAEVTPKAVRPDTDIVAELVARGDADLGVVVLTQILTTPGVELAGPLPAEVQSYVTFVGGIGTASGSPEVAARLITFLSGPQATAVMREQGMEPLPRR